MVSSKTITLAQQHVVRGRAYETVTIRTIGITEQYIGPRKHVAHVLAHPKSTIEDFRGITTVTLVERHAGINCVTTLVFNARDQVHNERVVDHVFSETGVIYVDGNTYLTQDDTSVATECDKIIESRAVFTDDNTIKYTGIAIYAKLWMFPFEYNYVRPLGVATAESGSIAVGKEPAAVKDEFDATECRIYIVSDQYCVIYKELLYVTADQSEMKNITQRAPDIKMAGDGDILVTGNGRTCVFTLA